MGFIVEAGIHRLSPLSSVMQKQRFQPLRCWRKGICAPAIRPPAVPEGESRIRLTVTADRSLQDIDELTEAFDSIRKELNINK